jgi:hypothetical protein
MIYITIAYQNVTIISYSLRYRYLVPVLSIPVFGFRNFCFIRLPLSLLSVDPSDILSALLFESAVLEAQLHSQVLPFRLGGLAHRPHELEAKENLMAFVGL